jgi:hypothetical protein
VTCLNHRDISPTHLLGIQTEEKNMAQKSAPSKPGGVDKSVPRA